jgi:D-lyxose ketol-isomerase
MITRTEYTVAQKRAAALLKETGITLSDKELKEIAVADFGLSALESTGGQILTLVDTQEIAVKLIAMFPQQVLPEHKHPPLGSYPGKAETLRCEWGLLYLYTEGEPTASPAGHPPRNRHHTYTVWHEAILVPGDQITLAPNTWHWFQGGPEGAVVWSFSSRAVDIQDEFTDPDIQRQTLITEK